MITKIQSYSHRSAIRACFLLCTGIWVVSCFQNPHPAELTSEIIGFTSDAVTINTTINSDGGSDILQKGICISNHENPDLTDLWTIDGTGSGSYGTILNGLTETTWHIRSYAINSAGAGYGNDLYFSYASVAIGYFGDITGTTAFFSANVLYDGQIVSRGICWSTSANPTTDDSKTSEGTGTGIFTSTITSLTPGATYHARAYASDADRVFYSDELTFSTKDFPALTTKEINNSGSFILTSGGDIVSNGGAVIQHAGVCWSTHPAPTPDDQKTDVYTDLSTFNSDIPGLLPGTTYYMRAYATNLVGTGYGNEKTITMPAAALYDIDGNPYSSITTGTQVWTVENLRTTRYSNGDSITKSSDLIGWRNLTSEAWGYYDNNPQFEHPYGKLYNWFAVNDSRNICPTGWHVPTVSDWSTLIDFLGGSSIAGSKLKESGSVHWFSPDSGSTNSSGFTALPGGSRSGDFYLQLVGSSAIFWSRMEYNSDYAYCYSLAWHEDQIYPGSNRKQFGFSVRCVKDN